ncbi:unnamed protein product [Gordionus sp. m RMFG-2023]
MNGKCKPRPSKPRIPNSKPFIPPDGTSNGKLVPKPIPEVNNPPDCSSENIDSEIDNSVDTVNIDKSEDSSVDKISAPEPNLPLDSIKSPNSHVDSSTEDENEAETCAPICNPRSHKRHKNL